MQPFNLILGFVSAGALLLAIGGLFFGNVLVSVLSGIVYAVMSSVSSSKEGENEAATAPSGIKRYNLLADR